MPQRVVTNRDLEELIDTSDEWIFTRTGIRERRIAADDETVATMAVDAGQQALDTAHLLSSSLDLIIVATNTPDNLTPSCASLVQHALAAGHAAAFDMAAGCSGFIYALATAYQFIIGGIYTSALVVGSEVMSRMLDWQDRDTCILFGDGAGAVVVQAGDSADLLSLVLGSDGSGANLAQAPGVCGARSDAPHDGRYFLRMRGREVFRFAVERMPQAAKEAIAAAQLDISDIELFIPHQANERIIRSAAKTLGLPIDRVFMNMERYGNISAASPAIALCEAVEQGWVRKGDHVVMVAFGSGLTWAAMVLEWQS